MTAPNALGVPNGGAATGISIWFRDQADHHMTIRPDSDGPFKRCCVEKGHSERQLEPLPLVDPPAGLFPAAPPT